MDQGANIRLVAEEAVQRLGVRAYAYLYEQAEIAKLTGDMESAISWWDIALASLETSNKGNKRFVYAAFS